MDCSTSTEVGGVCIDKRPQFITLLLHCNFMQKLEIPRSIATLFPESENQTVTLFCASLGKFWHVRLEQHGFNKYFYHGWESFAQAHHLREGNLLQFQYEGNMLMTVKIFNPNECNTSYVADKPPDQCQINYTEQQVPRHLSESCIKKPPASCSKKSKHINPKISSKEKEVTTQAVKTRRHSSPIFEKKIKPSSQGSMLLPRKFCSNYGVNEWNDITIKDPNGNQWTMRVSHYAKANHLTTGWVQFMRANDLQVGDKCIFGLLSNRTMQVQIVKNK